MRRIILLGYARQDSHRCRHKMTRPFGDSTLFERYLKKFMDIQHLEHPFSRILMAIYPGDLWLHDITKKSSVTLVERNEKSVAQGTEKLSEIQHYLKEYDEEYVLVVNGCFPFLMPETIIRVGNFLKENSWVKSLSCVRYRYNHFWDAVTHRPINNTDTTCLSTRLLPPVLENVNSMVGYSRDYMLTHDAYWGCEKNDPYLYTFPESIELLDIDTELDFRIGEALV